MQNKLNISKLSKNNENIITSSGATAGDTLYDKSEPATAWPAIIAGAVIAFAISLVLLFLGSGLGLAIVSPWSHIGISAATFTIATIVWIMIMQCIASGFGGYLTGRLCHRWEKSSSDEAYFRDTANGLLSWALATVITAVFFTYTLTPIASDSAKAATSIATIGEIASNYKTEENSKQTEQMNDYFVDNLFRSYSSNISNEDIRAETSRILTIGMTDGELAKDDKSFLSQIIATHAGITPDSANQRIDNIVEKINVAKQKAIETAEHSRKAGMKAALFMFASLLIGAFISSYFAAVGGKHRDT